MGIPISGLPADGAIADADLFPVVQSGTTYKATASQIATYISTKFNVYPYTVVTSTSQAMSPNNGYIANNAALVTLTLPATIAVGERLIIIGQGGGGWKIAQNAGQVINMGDTPTTSGTSGSLASTNQFDNVELICVVANTTFVTRAPQGNLTLT